MTEITLLTQNPQGLVLTWPKHDLANRYRLECLTETFSYQLVTYLEEPLAFMSREQLEKNGPYRIQYVYLDKVTGQECAIEATDLFYYTKPEPLNLVAIKSYQGGSLSFYSENHFDWYRVYQVTNSPQLLIETEDCQVTGSLIKEGERYQVEAYKKDDSGQLVLSALSESYTCQFRPTPHVTSPKLSVVVPVYNAEAFISRTVDAILLSSFQDVELLLINDGSKDKSGAICDWYQANYSNVRVIHKENGGVCSARNTGMDHATGEFIAFVDNDDLIHPYLYQKLYDAAISNGTDIAIGQTIMRTDINKSEVVLAAKDIKEQVSNHTYSEMMANKATHKNIYFVAIWNKIVRLSVARQVRFWDDIPYYEDTAYTSSLYTYIDKFTMVKGAYYIWDKRKQKTVGTATNTYKSMPSALRWRYYLLTLVAPLFQGNRADSTISDIYSLDILKQLLEDYRKYNLSHVQDLFNGMVKHYVTTYQVPVEQFASSPDDKLKDLYLAWQEIEASDAAPYDGW